MPRRFLPRDIERRWRRPGREDARWLPTDGRAGSLACELFDDVVEEQVHR
jgi:hypothetical protein